MRKKIRHILSDPLLSGSLVMVIGSNLTNAINYVYTLAMGRMLGPSSYGELASLFSLLGLLLVVPSTFGPVVVKFVSGAKSEKESALFISWLSNKVAIAGIATTIIFLIATPWMANFIKLDPTPVFILNVSFLFLLPGLLNKSALQGLLKFKDFVTVAFLENFLKLILGVSLVYLGWSIGGAITGLLLSSIFGWYYSKQLVNNYLPKTQGSPQEIAPILKYSLPVLINSLASTSFYSSDVILVKHFFSSYEAGIYSSIATLGRIIFFGTGPVLGVMFPLVSKKLASGDNYMHIFKYSLGITSLFSLGLLAVYWLFPGFFINLLYGQKYLAGSLYLAWYGVFIVLYTLASVFITLFMSANQVRAVTLPFTAALLQIMGIWFFHNSLTEVITVSVVVTALLLVSLFVYFAYAAKVNLNHSSSL